jgi:endoglycosylceramidase
VRRALAILLGALLLGPCPPAAAAELRVDGQRIVDADGREVLLRGGALIEKAAPGLPRVSERDWQQMRELGWNSIRLGTAWQWIEPERGVLDHDYLDALAALAREAMDEGFNVVVDMHQDVWGPPVGNGAPAWTVHPACAPLHVDLAGPSGTWAANYLSPWTFCQFNVFWEDAELQSHLATAWREVARRVGDHPRMAGYDLMNEPFQGTHPPGEFEARLLYPFYTRMAEAIREVDPDAVMYVEPANSKNVHLPTAPAVGDAPDPVVYAPHVYGLWDLNDAFTEREPFIDANMQTSEVEARLLGAPLWYGEFGMRRDAPDAEATLTHIYDVADRQRAGAAVWEYARNQYGLLRSDGSLDPARARTVARPYPRAVSGTVERLAFDAAAGVFELEWQAAEGDTEIALPPLRFGEGAAVEPGPGVRVLRDGSVDGVLVVEADPGARRLAVHAPQR